MSFPPQPVSGTRARRRVLRLAMLGLAWAWSPPDGFAGALVALASRPAAPDFALPDLAGRVHRLSAMRGEVVLINFWASWCAPCRAEMPSLQRLQDGFKRGGLRILAVNLGESHDDVTRFADSLSPRPRFDLLLDRDMSAARSWPMRGLPVTYIIDVYGRVTHVSRGARHWDDPQVFDLIDALGRDDAS